MQPTSDTSNYSILKEQFNQFYLTNKESPTLVKDYKTQFQDKKFFLNITLDFCYHLLLHHPKDTIFEFFYSIAIDDKLLLSACSRLLIEDDNIPYRKNIIYSLATNKNFSYLFDNTFIIELIDLEQTTIMKTLIKNQHIQMQSINVIDNPQIDSTELLKKVEIYKIFEIESNFSRLSKKLLSKNNETIKSVKI